MTLGERMSTATMLLVVAYAIGAILFFSVRGIVLSFVEKFQGDAVPKCFLVIALGYPAAVVYSFVFHPIAGFVVLLPLLVVAVAPELSMVNWKTEPSVKLPEDVQLTSPLRKVDGRLQTRVNIDGEDWSAEFAEDGLRPPSQGDTVRIVERQGLKLVIARVEQG